MEQNIIQKMFILGGPCMYLLLAFLFAALFFIIDRMLFFIQFKWKTSFPGFVESNAGMLSSGNGFHSCLVRNYNNNKNNADKFNSFMELDCQQLVGHLEKNLDYLTAIATLAPVTGFLGTVTGMITAFHEITGATDVTPQLVAAGIYQALVTTAAGLIISVFASLFYFIFSGIIKRYSMKMEQTVNTIYKQISGCSESNNEA